MLQDRTNREPITPLTAAAVAVALMSVAIPIAGISVFAQTRFATVFGTATDEIDHIFVVTTTGLTTPSLDALLASCLGLRANVRRSPLFGLGCAGGAGALIRACDVLSARPTERALVVSVELGSLIFSKQAQTPTDLVGVALFGDGAAAVLLGGDDVAGEGIRIAHTRTAGRASRRGNRASRPHIATPLRDEGAATRDRCVVFMSSVLYLS